MDLNETYVKKLESLISDKKDKIDVINGGVIGYNIFQCLTYLKQKGIRYNPDAVVYFFFIDDMQGPNSEQQVREVYQSFSRSEENAEKLHKISHSYLINFVKNVYTFLWNKYRWLNGADWLRNIEDRKKLFHKELKEVIEGNFDTDLLNRHLSELNALTQDEGIKLLLVFIPDAVQIHNPQWQKINYIVREACRSQQIPFLDITTIFEKEFDIVSLYLFPIDAHTSPKGNTIIANNIYKKIKKLDWLLKE